MAVDNDMQIILRATLDQSKTAIKELGTDIKTIQKALKEGDTRVRLESFINVNRDAINSLKKDIAVISNQLKDTKIALSYELNLNKENKDALKEKINELSSKKDIPKIKIGVKLDTSDSAISTLKKDIEALAKKLKDTPIVLKTRLDTKSEEGSGSNASEGAVKQTDPALKITPPKQYQDNSDMISSSIKMSDITGTVTSTDVVKNNLLEIEKTLRTVNKNNEVIASTSEIISEYEKAKVKLYKEQQKVQSEIFGLEKLRPKANEDQVKVINSEIQSRQKLLSQIGQDLDHYKIRDKQLDDEYESYVRIQEIKQQIFNAKAETGDKDDSEAMSRQAYSQLIKLSKEEFAIKKALAKASGEELNILERKLALNRKTSSDIELTISEKGLEHEKLRLKYMYERKQALMDLSIAESNVDNKETLRVKKLGKEVATKEENNIDFGDVASVEKWAKAHYGGSVSVRNHSQSIQDLNNEQMKFTVVTKSSNGLVQEYKMAVDKATGSVYQMGTFTREAGRRQLDLANDIKIAISRMFEWDIAMKMVRGTMQKFNEGVDFIKEIDKDLTQIAITTGQTRQEVSGLTKEYVAMGEQMGKTVREISNVNAELVRQGLSIEESTARMQTILKLSATGEMDVNETLSVITSSVNALGESAERTADVLLKAGQISASGADSIGEALRATASSAKATGMSIEELSAIISTMIDVTQESPSSLGNSLKTIIARFNNVKEETGEVNEELNKVQKAFESVGITFVDATGQIRPLFNLLTDLSGIWDTLNKNQKSYIATQSAGVRQQNRFYAIMENFDKIQDYNEELMVSNGTLEESYQTYLTSVEASANKARVALEELWLNTIQSDSLKGFYDNVTAIIKVVDKLGVVFIASSASTALMISKLGGYKKSSDMLRQSLMVLRPQSEAYSKATLEGIKFTEGMTKAQKIATIVATQLGVTALPTATTGTTGYTLATAWATAKTVGLTVAISALQAVLTGGLSLILSGVISGVVGLVSSSKDATDEINEMMATSRDSIKTHSGNIKTLKNLGDEYEELTSKMGEYGDASKLNTEEQERYYEIVSQIAEIAPELVMGYDAQGRAILKNVKNLDQLIQREQELISLEEAKMAQSSKALSKEVAKEVKDIQKNLDKVSGKADRSKDVEDLEKILNSETASAQKKKEALEDIQKIRAEQTAISAETKIYTSELEQQKQKLMEIVNIDVSKMFNDTKMNGAMQGIANDFVNDAFTKAFEEDVKTAIEAGNKAVVEFELIYKKLSDIIGSDLDITDNAEELEGVLNVIEGMGYPTEQASNMMYKLVSAMLDGNMASNSLATGLGVATNAIKNLYNEVSKLNGMYAKLASGQRLAVEEMLDLIEKMPEVAEYIAETGDLSLQEGEMIKKVTQEKYAEMQRTIELKKQEAQQTKQVLEQELVASKKNLEWYKTVSGIKSDVYKAELAKYEELENRLASNTEELQRFGVQAQAIKHTLAGGFADETTENYADIFDETTKKLESYNSILKEINKSGKLSGDTNKSIIADHKELIHLLGNEEEMRKYLVTAIAKQGEKQQEVYKKMVYSSESYYDALYAGNRELIDRLGELYQIDLSNFKTVNDAKIALAQSSANAVMREYSKLSSNTNASRADMLRGLISEGEKRMVGHYDNEVNRKQMEEWKEELAILEKLDENIVSGFTMPDINFTPSGSAKKESKPKTYKKIEMIKLETDAYLKLVKAMEEVDRFSSNNKQLLQYAIGKDRVNLLAKEVALLDKKKELTSKQAEEYRKERDSLEKTLGAKFNLKDGTYGMDSYRTYMKTQENAINSVIKQLNGTTDEKLRESLEEQKGSLEKHAQEVEDAFNKYIEIQLDILPDLSSQWWDIAYEKFSVTLEMMETDLAKYADKVEKITTRMNMLMMQRSDQSNEENLKKEYKLMMDIADVYSNSLEDINVRLADTSKMVEKYEKQLQAMGNKRDAEYERISRHLILARAEQDKLIEAYEEGLNNIANQQRAIIDKFMEHLNKAKDKIVKDFNEIREEIEKPYKFSMVEFDTSFESLLADLDKIDKIFMKNPEYNLSTEDARDELDSWKDKILDSLGQIKDYESEIEDIMNMKINDEKDLAKQKEKLLELIEDQIGYEEELKEIYNSVKDQLLEMQLEHKKIEDALQNQIDIKQEELNQLKEQFEKEDKIKSMLQKQLDIMRAMDDTRYSYITGQGEEIFTYDQSKVMELQQQIADMNQKDNREKQLKALEDEIKKMQENLSKTKEINAKELETLQLAEKNLSQILGLLDEQINKNMGEDRLDKVFEKIADQFIDGIETALDPLVSRLEDLWDAVDKRLDVQATPSKPTINTDDKPKTKSYTIQKGDTLDKIAKKIGTTVDKLIELNPDKKWNKHSMLYYNQQMNIPAFETGGYTGDWSGNGGKLAVLHKKELILNQDDTKNILQSLNIAKAIGDNIKGLQLPSIEGGTSTTENQQIIQNMNIYGVKDVNDFRSEMNKLFRRGIPTLS